MVDALLATTRRLGSVAVFLTTSAIAGPAADSVSRTVPRTVPLRPAQIILIRHAEKPSDPADPHLSPAGVERAERWVSFFMSDPAMTRFGRPVAVFATKTTKDENGQRTQETVKPLADALNLPVQAPYHGKDYAALATLVLREAAYAGKTLVICWNHEEIPQLVTALGVTPEPSKWNGSVFDQVYVITYRDGNAALTVRHFGGTGHTRY